ncbi:MAG: hypothetical protein IPO43_11060 [Rhodoferax sp.]|nr:hypothetical protein [Rhodoferax sp.]
MRRRFPLAVIFGSALLEAVAYQFALGSFASLSFAENSGSGALADGCFQSA